MADTTNSPVLVAPTTDPIALMVQNLFAPATNKTTSSPNAPDLQQLLTQLTNASTPGGAADQIKQIFTLGNQTGMPVIQNNVTAGGGRGGTSSYQALATNDLQSRLAGTAATALQQNAAQAVAAANALGQTNNTQVSKPQMDLSTLLTQIGIGAGANMAGKTIGSMYKGSSLDKLINGAPTSAGVAAGGLAPVDATTFTGNSAAATIADATAPAAADASVSAAADMAASGLSQTGVTSLGSAITNGIIGGAPSAADIVGGLSGAAPVDLAAGGAAAAGTLSGVTAADLTGASLATAATDAGIAAATGTAAAAGTTAAVAGGTDLAATLTDAAITGAPVGTIICTKLYELGHMPVSAYVLDSMFGKQLAATDPDAYTGYIYWAKEVVRWMSGTGKFNNFIINTAISVAYPWSKEMARQVTREGTAPVLGKLFMTLGLAGSRLIGRVNRGLDKAHTAPMSKVGLAALLCVVLAVRCVTWFQPAAQWEAIEGEV